MPKRPAEQAWRMAMIVIALTATVLALYFQLAGMRSRAEEAQAAAARLEEALAGSRTRLKAEILAELRADLAKSETADQSGREPLPDTILRRLESGEGDLGTLEQVIDPTRPGGALLRFNQALQLLSQQMEESDRMLRRDLEAFRIEVRGELDAVRRGEALMLAVLILLVIDLLLAFWRDRSPGT
jgi:hypothetical protein